MQVLGIWLDGFDMGLADAFELPVLGELSHRSARATLDNGSDHLTGLSGEHLATGLDPRDAGRASAVWFDPETYECHQRGTALTPIYGGVPTVVLDPCYFDLSEAPGTVQGVTDWGAHDPGGPGAVRPLGLRGEIEERFGAYPARPWLYATPWASPELCTQAGASLSQAVSTRNEIATWLLGERLTDWDLALVGVSEAHSASEGLYHGVDPSPRWSACASRHEAEAGLRSVYTEIDRLVGELIESFPDCLHVVFAMHGMGPNASDVPSMVLLGELLRRWAGDHTPDAAFEIDDNGLPLLDPGSTWGEAVWAALGEPIVRPRRRSLARRIAGRVVHTVVPRPVPKHQSLRWMPTIRHQPHWPRMRAFAVPSFYDGRVRLNVVGREAQGQIEPRDYRAALDEVDALLAECRDPITGEPVVVTTMRPTADPFDLDPTDADLIVTWAPGVYGISHPRLGTIGPIPPRRTGGHTRPVGRCLVHGPGVEPLDLGQRSSFDVVPTLLALAGSAAPWAPSGRGIDVTVGGAGSA